MDADYTVDPYKLDQYEVVSEPAGLHPPDTTLLHTKSY